MPEYRGWEIIRPLGEGGQGQVFLARNPARAEARHNAKGRLRYLIRNIGGNSSESSEKVVQELLDTITNYSRPDSFDELGALKQFKMPTEGEERVRAIQRFKNEIGALRMVGTNSAALQVLEFDEDKHWMITDYHSGGSLGKHPEMFRGDLEGALRTLRPIVAVLAALHEKGIVHRDIKPHNLLIGSAGQLVLGDFGIVFLEQSNRPTELLERVGSRDWMAPWAHTGMRVDDVKPSFDVFPLGKVIWSMISGCPMLPFWYHRQPEYDLTKLFPSEPAMHVVNELLDKCVVQFEKDCAPSAGHVLKWIDQTLRILRLGGHAFGDAVPYECRVCGTGYYRRVERDPISLGGSMAWIRVAVYICNACSNVQTFAVNPPK